MIRKEIATYLKGFSDNLILVNKLIVEAFLRFNGIQVKNNKLILSCLDGNDENQIEHFISLIKSKNGKFDFEDLTQLFEITIPSQDVITNGAVYTPNYIKNYIVTESFKVLSQSDFNEITVADIACGTGAFLFTAAEKIQKKTSNNFFEIFQKNIFGLDISDYTIERAKILLSLLAISNGEDKEEFQFNLRVGNALNFDWEKEYPGFKGFDVVVGNPPYVRAKHLSQEARKHMTNWETTKTGNPDLYIPFFEIGLDYLKNKGVLSFITVNTFKRSVNARNLRGYFKSNNLNLSIIDFGNQQVFENKSTYTCIVFIRKNTSENVKYTKANPDDLLSNNIAPFTEINYKLLNTQKGWILNKNNVLENIRKIESSGLALGKKYPIKNGLATLSNDIFIFKPVDEDEKYYYHQNGGLHKIEKGVCRDIIKPNRLKTEDEIPELTEKIIFPYYYKNSQLSFFKDSPKKQKVFNEQYFQDIYPNAYYYLKLNQEQLFNRDKGKEKKYKWFEFGRSQALTDFGKKLLFPYMSSKPYFVFTNQEDLLLYAGYAIFNDSERELQIVKRILESQIFWYYITNTSKPYSGNFYALAKNYVKDFGICELTTNEEDFLLKTDSSTERDKFLMDKYCLNPNILG
ncbi:MAG: N-6 DNA methylase [Bacteroidales bacterium]|nr:N-6 DNA methylase [Bacteroidales bacterium]